MTRVLLALALVAGCSAPTTAPPGRGGPAPSPAPEPAAPAVQHRPPPPEPTRPPPAPAPAGPTPEVLPTPTADLAGPPFTAWTTTAPLTIVAPGGTPVTTLKRLGVRVEVLQVLDARVRVRCTGCAGDLRDAEGWLQPERIRAARTAGRSHDPLTEALKRRARWASGSDLPGGAAPASLCALVDQGFTLQGDTATWSADGGRLVLQWDGAAWSLDAATAPTGGPPWPCQANPGSRPSAPPRTP